MEIEDIVLNLAFKVYHEAVMFFQRDAGSQTFKIGAAEIKFRDTTNSIRNHFAQYVLNQGEEFSLTADIWATHIYSDYREMINDSLYESQINPHIKYENTDLVISEGGRTKEGLYLIRNPSADKILPVKSFASCFLMRYTWRGDVDLFEREVFAEQVKSNLFFKRYFENAIVIKGNRDESHY